MSADREYLNESNELRIPKIMPLLPLRNTVIYPQ